MRYSPNGLELHTIESCFLQMHSNAERSGQVLEHINELRYRLAQNSQELARVFLNRIASVGNTVRLHEVLVHSRYISPVARKKSRLREISVSNQLTVYKK